MGTVSDSSERHKSQKTELTTDKLRGGTEHPSSDKLISLLCTFLQNIELHRLKLWAVSEQQMQFKRDDPSIKAIIKDKLIVRDQISSPRCLTE